MHSLDTDNIGPSALLFCFLISINSFSQQSAGPKLRFEHLGTDQGFPQAFMSDIKQDKTGFIWIGTRDGVYRYDGYTFRSFSHPANDKDFFKSQEINSICISSDSTVWVAARNGLFYYDATKEKLVRLNFMLNKDHSFADMSASSVCEDHKGNLWFVTGEGDLMRINLKTKKPELFYRNEKIKNVFIDHNANIWMGTDDEGMYCLNPVTKKMDNYQTDPKNKGSICGNNIKQIIEDRNGIIWVATFSGLSRFDLISKTFTNYTMNKNDPGAISSPGLNCIMADHNGVIWAGGYRGGLSRFDSSTGKFTNYRNDPADPQSIGSNHIQALCEDRSGVLWAGTTGGGLNKVSLNKEKFIV